MAEKQTNWRDEIPTRWANWSEVIAALDRVLASGEFPALEQSQPVECGTSPTVRFTVQLAVDPSDHDQPPEIFIPINPEEALKAKGTRDGLELMFTRKIAQNAFRDASNNLVRTSVLKGSDGVWRAVTVDGLTWTFDEGRGRWIKEKAEAA